MSDAAGPAMLTATSALDPAAGAARATDRFDLDGADRVVLPEIQYF